MYKKHFPPLSHLTNETVDLLTIRQVLVDNGGRLEPEDTVEGQVGVTLSFWVPL